MADALAAADGQALAGNSATFEERVPDAATGELRVFLATKSPLRGVDGAVSGTVTVTRDVTSRVHAEAQLRASEERLRLAFEVGGIGAWDIDLLTGDVFESPEIGAMYGLPSGQTNRHVRETRTRIHPDDLDGVEARIVAAMGDGEPFAVENRILRADGSVGWIASRGRVLYDDSGTAVRAVGVTRDITADRAAQRAIIESEDRFRTLTDHAPALIFAADAAGSNSFVNRRYMDYTGESFQALCGLGWHAVVHPDDLPMVRDGAAARQHDGYHAVEHRLRIRGHDGSWRWFLLHAEPVAHASPATPFHWMGICVDIDAQVQAEERERLLAAEVDHRAKNMLAVVQAVVQLTRADTAAALKTAINDRIASLARAHSLLAASRWEGINLGELAREELAAFRERVELGGPEVRLRPAAAQALALVLHELTTNAVKYGGLSTPQGALTLTWSWTAGDGGQQLAIHWVETGGPPVVPPQVRGFGSTVLKSSIERQLHGRLNLDWRPEGLVCELWLPADQLAVADTLRPPAPAAAPRPAVPAALLSQQRLLIVEDELLVALQLETLATEAGCAVVGSAASSVEARAILAAHAPTMALLDINLGTERSYDFADTLMARGVPFAFCTGYAGDGEVPDRFKGCIRLTKPVDAAQLRQVLGQLATG